MKTVWKIMLAPVLIWVWLLDTFDISFCGLILVLGTVTYLALGAGIWRIVA